MWSPNSMKPTVAQPLMLLVASLVALSASSTLPAQGNKLLSLDDVSQAGRFVARGLPGLQWHPDAKSYCYLKRVKGEAGMVAVDVGEGGKERTLLTASQFTKACENAKVSGGSSRDLFSLKFNDDGELIGTVAGQQILVELSGKIKVRVLRPEIKGAEVVVSSPDGSHAAYVKDKDIYFLKSMQKSVRVTFDGNEDMVHGLAVSRVEFGIKDGLWWAPNGERFAFYREDFSPIAPYPYVDHEKRPAALVKGRYPMAGQPGSVVSIGVYCCETDAVTWLGVDHQRDEYLTNVTWSPDGGTLYVAHVNRAQDHMELVAYDARTGKRQKRLFIESDREWIEPEHGPIFIPGGGGDFLWVSYRDGFRNFWRYRSDGRLAGQVTDLKFDITDFKGFDDSGKGFFFEATGKDARQIHLFHCTLGKPARQLTQGRGKHTAQISPDGQHLLDVHTNLELPQATDLISIKDAKVLKRIHEAKDPLAGYAKASGSLFETKTEDGQTIYGYLLLPPGLDANTKEKIPAIQYVYGGPHSQLVTDSWICGLSRWNLWLQYMAQRGYACFIVDGRGTNHRGIEWQQAIHRQMGVLEANDQVAGLNYVLKNAPVDPARVGVTGWSYGGFMTLTLMTQKAKHYAAGVSGAPVTDWAYYETGYGERYMDRPGENSEGYRRSNPGHHVEKMKGELLVVQGSRDPTVMWQSTIDFIDKCIKAGVQVDYMVYPNQLHGLRGASFRHFVEKMTRFFNRTIGAKN